MLSLSKLTLVLMNKFIFLYFNEYIMTKLFIDNLSR